jgi:putative transposase
MILTYKIRHGRDFTSELKKAIQVAQFAVQTHKLSSAAVKHIDLKSIIANQILRKYGRNKNIRKVSSVNLIIPNQGIRIEDNFIIVPCLNLKLQHQIPVAFSKINQIEINNEFAFVSVTVDENSQISPQSWIGVDRNTTGYCAVVANPSTGKVLKLGKKAQHIHKKYMNMRKKFQKQKKYTLLKKIKNRESNIVRDLNHKISRRIVDYAKNENAGIVLEDLTGIRKTSKQSKTFRYSLHSWSYYQLERFIEYKAKLLGIPVVKIDPQYTSQQCSRCGLLGNRKEKKFSCDCGNVEDADVNASFVISLRHQGILRLPEERVSGKGSTDTPKEALA